MIEYSDEYGTTSECAEPAVIALLIELEVDSYYDTDLDLHTRGRYAEHTLPRVKKARKVVLRRHAARLTHQERDLIDRASAEEFEHAAWILQARAAGLHYNVWPDFAPQEELKVTYRLGDWSPRSGNKTRLFTDRDECAAWVEQLRGSSNVDYLHVQYRPVGSWLGATGIIDYIIEDEEADNAAYVARMTGGSAER